MYCKYCHNEVPDDAVMCPICGFRLKREQKEMIGEDEKNVFEPRIFDIFATMGLIIGIVDAVCIFFTGLSAEPHNFLLVIPLTIIYLVGLGIPGMVFSLLGMRASFHNGRGISGAITILISSIVEIALIIAIIWRMAS